MVTSQRPVGFFLRKPVHDYIEEKDLNKENTHNLKYVSEIVYQISVATSQRPLGIFLREIGHD